MRAVLIREFGGLDAMEQAEVPRPEPGPGEVLIEVTRAGVNFGDTHARENAYIAKQDLPLIPGSEVAGTLEDGTRVIAMPGKGGYAEFVAAPEKTVFPIPDGVSDEQALALFIQGLTAWHLYRTAGRVAQRESVVVHSAAGGVGSLAVQLGKPMGAGRVIATAGSEERRALALELGADAAIDGATEDLAGALVEANEGKPVDVVFEAAGGRVFEQSMEALAPLGRCVVYGISSREQVEVRTGKLLKNSHAVVGFWLMHLLERRELLAEPLEDLFARAARGELRAVVGGTYPLSEVRRAHDDLQGRRTRGKLLLDPSV